MLWPESSIFPVTYRCCGAFLLVLCERSLKSMGHKPACPFGTVAIAAEVPPCRKTLFAPCFEPLGVNSERFGWVLWGCRLVSLERKFARIENFDGEKPFHGPMVDRGSGFFFKMNLSSAIPCAQSILQYDLIPGLGSHVNNFALTT